jgi:hypothetical protein
LFLHQLCQPPQRPASTTTTVAALRSTDEGPTDEVLEAGRWGGWRSWWRNKYSHTSYHTPTYYTPTYTTTTKISDYVSPVITTGVGTVAASCTGTSTYSRGWGYDKYMHSIKHSNKKQFSSKNTCCDGYLCKSAAAVTAKLTDSISQTSELPPYSEITVNVGSCCLSQADFAITKLLCDPAAHNDASERCAGDILTPVLPSTMSTPTRPPSDRESRRTRRARDSAYKGIAGAT